MMPRLQHQHVGIINVNGKAVWDTNVLEKPFMSTYLLTLLLFKMSFSSKFSSLAQEIKMVVV